MNDGLGLFLVLAIFLLAFWFCILLPMRIAEARGRSGLGWVIISLIFSPPLAIMLLLVLGDARR